MNKSSSQFWNNLHVTWKPCADLPDKGWVLSVAKLDRKLYISMLFERGGYGAPLVYDPSEDQWASLPALPYTHFSLVAIPECKQLLAIGGMVKNHGTANVSNKVFLWDENNKKWGTPYPNMPTARYRCSSVSHGLNVIVAGGVTCQHPWTLTRTVEVLCINELKSTRSCWVVVEQLPHIVREAIPLIINEKLYIAQGHDNETRTCNIVTTSLPELLQSSNKDTSSSQVWNKLPDMPYSSYSISHYQGRLITFGGSHKVERPDGDKLVVQSVPMIHIYNSETKSWDCVAEIPQAYLLGKSIHTQENTIFFMGGLTGKYTRRNNDDMVMTCFSLVLSHHDN